MLPCTDSATLFNTLAVCAPNSVDAAWGGRPRRALSEAEPIANGEFRRDRQPTAFRLDQQFTLALRALPYTYLEADEFLLAFRRCANKPPACTRSLARPQIAR